MIYNDSKYNSDWEIKALNQLGEFRRGKSKHRPRNDIRLFENGTYPLVQTGEISAANLYIRSHSAAYNEFGLKQSKLWPKETLCITIAANIAETALLGYPMCFPDSIVGFNAYPDESSELFMHYVFTYIKKSIQNSASGSIQDNINIDYLTSLKFRIPDKKYQDIVVNVLSSLDRKIEINNQINEKLGALSKLIYDYWFIQFEFPDENGNPYKASGGQMIWNEQVKLNIPVGWTSCLLEDVISSTGTGLNPRDNFVLGEGENFYVTIKNIDQGRILLDDKCDRISDKSLEIINKRSDLKVGDILFTSIEPVGITYLILEKPKNWNINESVFTIRPDYDKVTSEYLFMFLSGDYIKSYTQNVSAGSIHKGIRHSTLKACKFILPDLSTILSFTDKISPMLKQMDIIQKENQKLVQIRDWLLPMLMNGQVKPKGDNLNVST
ncbi:MAG: restriction endonuclease subunit S [Bacteroidetes bacterium]|nr:restriction endonuclease subunit S [Bacteroidota bacterium]